LVFALVGTGMMLSWIPELPDPLAVHWNAGGTPDGFGSLAGLILMLVGYTAVFSVIVVGSLAVQRATPQVSTRPRLLVAITVWLAATMTFGVTGLVAAQRGLTDAAETGSVVAPFVAGVVVGIVLGAVAWFLTPLPMALDDETTGEAQQVLDLGSNERAVWSRTARPATKTVVGFSVLFVVLVASVLPVALTSTPWMWSMIALVVFVFAASTVCFHYRVTVTHRGLSVQSSAGFPSVHVPVEEISSVRALDINPFMDFGGWGWRWAAGRTGIVVRAGDALEVTRTSGKILVVTVDDAATAVALLEGLLRRRQTSAPPASA
jgi:uncharacterized membrane protein